MKIAKTLKSISFAAYVLYASLFFVGIFHVYLSCILSIVLIIKLCSLGIKNKQYNIRLDMSFIAIAAMVLFYAISALWAVDSGTAIFGFFKFLPLPLYMILLMQEENGREKVISHLPYLTAIMTLLSIGLMYIPGFESYFAVAGRLSGFVQYPNSFALILLVAELLLITKEKPIVWDYICMSILLFGILFTGSRTVFILAVISNAVALIINKNRIVRRIAFVCIGAGIALVLLYCLITDNFIVLARYLRISLDQSTFVGRMLYAHDALPVILRNPFGLGYMGYYFIQPSIQTGLYSIMFVHNDLLQIMLDVGWLPFVLFMAAVVMTLINKSFPSRYKLILITMLLHSAFDFDLQYIAIFMMLLLFLAPKTIREITLKAKKCSLRTASIILICLCLYFGTAQALTRFKQHETAVKFYDHNTVSDIELIKNSVNTKEAEAYADKILNRNKYISLAYSVKARAAYEKGDFGSVIKYKNASVELGRFVHSEIWEYAEMLLNGITLYTKAGDTRSAEICKQELISLSNKISEKEKLISKYGAAIEQQPQLYFPRRLRPQIEEIIGGE